MSNEPVATFGQATHTLTIMADQNVNSAHLRTLHDVYLSDLIQAIVKGVVPTRNMFRAKLGLNPIVETFRFTVDYRMSLAQMIEAGRYDSIDTGINLDRFPMMGRAKSEWEGSLIHFDRTIDCDSADIDLGQIARIASRNTDYPWSAGAAEHLLAFGVQLPEEQKKFAIIATGSRPREATTPNLWAICLNRICKHRTLEMVERWQKHPKECRFLLVREIPKS